MPTDLLISGVRIVPLDGGAVPDGPVDVLIEDGVVAEVGPGLSAPAAVERIDAGGRWAVPGLWDFHTHLGIWTSLAGRLDTSAARSKAAVLDTVRRALADGRSGLVVGQGHNAAAWPEPGTVAELDAVSGATPVVLVNLDCHHGWCNSAALDLLGLPRRDEPVQEFEWYAAATRLSALEGDAATSPEAYWRMLLDAASRGIVGLVDLEFSGGWQGWSERWSRGCDLLRVRTGVYAPELDDAVAAGLRTGAVLPGCDDRATMGMLKHISDGSLGTRTAWCCDDYAGTHEHGSPNQTYEELVAMLGKGRDAGFQIATHAIGDRALDQALDAYAATGATGTIEHAQLIRLEAAPRMAALGLIASMQPAHLLDDREPTELVWPGRADRCFAFRTLLDAGVRIALGSDAPVAKLDPWLAIEAAVHRSADGLDPWHPEQAMTLREALASSVDEQRVAVGGRGDVVLLDRDPLTAAPGDLTGMTVSLTTVAGQVVHAAL